MSQAVAPTGWRCKKVKKRGKRLFRGTFLNFLSRQSRIPRQPVLEADLFPWAEEFAKNWPSFR